MGVGLWLGLIEKKNCYDHTSPQETLLRSPAVPVYLPGASVWEVRATCHHLPPKPNSHLPSFSLPSVPTTTPQLGVYTPVHAGPLPPAPKETCRCKQAQLCFLPVVVPLSLWSAHPCTSQPLFPVPIIWDFYLGSHTG